MSTPEEIQKLRIPRVKSRMRGLVVRLLPFVVISLWIIPKTGWAQGIEESNGISNRSEQLWWRSGLLEIAGSYYVLYGFVKNILRQKLIRTKFVTPKDQQDDISDIKFFTPHILVALIALMSFYYSYVRSQFLWYSQGMQTFLFMTFLIMVVLSLTSTVAFNRLANWVRRIKERRFNYNR